MELEGSRGYIRVDLQAGGPRRRQGRCYDEVIDPDEMPILPRVRDGKCLEDAGFQVEGRLGAGAFGEVLAISRSGKPHERYAAKVQQLIAEGSAYLSRWEAFCIRRLSQAVPQLTPKLACKNLAPQLEQAFFCNDRSYIIMERLDENIEQLVRRKGGGLPFRYFERLVSLCIQLGNACGLVHGDMKLDNILRKGTKIFIIDFAFSHFSDCGVGPETRQAGWMVGLCDRATDCIQIPEDPRWWGEFNAWQLEKSLLKEGVHLILSSGRLPFTGMPDTIISNDARRQFVQECVDLGRLNTLGQALLENDFLLLTKPSH